MIVTLYGMNNYYPLFSDITVPEKMNKDMIVNDIMAYCGQQAPYFQEPKHLKKNIDSWFLRNKPNFERLYETILFDYDPIENYNKFSDIWRDTDGTDNSTHDRTDNGSVQYNTQTNRSDMGTDVDTTSENTNRTEKPGETIERSSTETETPNVTKTTSGESTETPNTTKRITNTSTETPNTTVSTTNEHKISAFDTNVYNDDYIDDGTQKTTGTNKTSVDGTESMSGTNTINNSSTESTSGNTNKRGSGTETHSGTNTITETKEGSVNKSINETHNESHTGTDTTTDKSNATDDRTYSEDEHIGEHTHGNIGVKTTQSMIEEERNIAYFDVYRQISIYFEREFMCRVY